MTRFSDDVVVRAADTADHHRITSLSGLDVATGRLLQADLADGAPRHVLVATDPSGTAVVGVAIATDQADAAHLLDLVVAPSHRRRGVARRLVAHLARTLVEVGTSAVTLEVRVGNHAAHALYAALGFEDVGLRPGYYQDGEDARILWHRDLASLAALAE